MTDYTPTPKLPDFFAPIPMSGALTYTPTTEVVEANYEYSNWLQRAGNREQYEAEFDRWLDEVKAQEAKAERERIKQRLWDDGYLYEMERDHVWALIEGDVE